MSGNGLALQSNPIGCGAAVNGHKPHSSRYHRDEWGTHRQMSGPPGAGAVFAKRAVTRGVLFAMSVLCIALSLSIQGCRELHQSFYPTLANAINSGEITRGWLPDFMPATTRDIHIAYDPSSPMTWCAFKFSPDDSQLLRTHLASSKSLSSSVRNIQSSGWQWWPDFLKGNLDRAAIQNRGFTVYEVTEQDKSAFAREILFVINWQTGYGYFYRTAGG